MARSIYDIYNARDAEEVLRRFNALGFKNLSLREVVDSLEPHGAGSALTPGQLREAQAGFIAARIAGENTGLSEHEAYSFARGVLDEEPTEDELYLLMWAEVRGKSVFVGDHLNSINRKRDMLEHFFRATRERRENLEGKSDNYVGAVFEKVFRGAEKRAVRYGLLPEHQRLFSSK